MSLFSLKSSSIVCPRGALLSNSIIPEESSANPNSSSEQSIPSERTPLIFLGSRVSPFGRVIPNGAYAVFIPTVTLEAPQTTLKLSFPFVKVTRFSLSASGCFSFSKTSTTVIFSRCSPIVKTSSTSAVARVNFSPSSFGVISVGTFTKSLIQSILINMIFPYS